MNILFMSLGSLYNLNESSVHVDILKRLSRDHDVWLLCKNEGKPTEVTEECGVHVVRVHTGELKKTGIVRKGFNTILVERQFKEAIKKELSFRNKIYGDLSRDYSAKLVVQHFYDKDQPVPIWAVFETISLGEFGTMLLCVNDKVVKKIAKSVGINSAFNSDGRLLGKIVFTLKDLRNAVAHNVPMATPMSP